MGPPCVSPQPGAQSSARHLRAICASTARQGFQRPPQKPRLCDNILGTASLLIDKNQGLRTFPVMWACFAHDDSKTQTALGSAISGPPFGPFLEPCSLMFAKFPLIWYYFLQDASNTQTALGSAISGSLFGLFLEQCSSNSTLSFCCVVLLPARRFRNSAMAINTPPRDHLQGPPEPAKTQRKPQRPTPALPLGRHRRSHIDFNLILLTVAHFLKVASPKPSYCQQFHPKP